MDYKGLVSFLKNILQKSKGNVGDGATTSRFEEL